MTVVGDAHGGFIGEYAKGFIMGIMRYKGVVGMIDIGW